MHVIYDRSSIEPGSLGSILKAAVERWSGDDSRRLSGELAAALAGEVERRTNAPDSPPVSTFLLSIDSASIDELDAFAQRLQEVVIVSREVGHVFAAHFATFLALLCAERVKSDQRRATAH